MDCGSVDRRSVRSASGRHRHRRRQCNARAVDDATRFLRRAGGDRRRRGVAETQCQRHRRRSLSGRRRASRFRVHDLLYRNQCRRVLGAADHRRSAGPVRCARGLRCGRSFHGLWGATVSADSASFGQRRRIQPTRYRRGKRRDDPQPTLDSVLGGSRCVGTGTGRRELWIDSGRCGPPGARHDLRDRQHGCSVFFLLLGACGSYDGGAQTRRRVAGVVPRHCLVLLGV